MKIQKKSKKINYSSSIVEMVNFQQEITNDLNEADELELQANRLQTQAKERREYAVQRRKLFMQIGEEYYPLEKIKQMIENAESPTQKFMLVSIKKDVEKNGHSEGTIMQLYTIDPEILKYLEERFPLTRSGKFDFLLTDIFKKGVRK